MPPPFASWEGNKPITTPSGNIPLTSHGPSLVVTPTTLYVFYSGKGKEEIWCASTSAPNFPSFLANDKAKSIDDGSIPRTDFRPAAAILPNGLIHLVYEGHGGGNLWWSWFDGAQTWFANIALPFTGYQLQPTLAYFNQQLHLVWHDQVAGSPGHEYLMHSALTLPSGGQRPTISDWSPAQPIADGAKYPSLVAFTNPVTKVEQLYIIARNYPYAANPVPEGFVFTKWDGGRVKSNLTLEPLVITGTTPKTAEGPTALVIGETIVFVYQGAGGADLWYAWMDVDPKGNEQFYGNTQITTSSSTPQASAVVGMASFANQLCIGYKGHGNNIFLTYTPL